MAAISGTLSLKDRLRVAKYSRRACLSAMRGEEIPLALGDPVHRLCVIRGIRYNNGCGTALRGVLPVFTRALNARSIMSNAIPAMESTEDIPYCIWHPETASEDTYRKLARRHPSMVYQIGRACAVAGYIQLYQELDIWPDAHIAEEARECGNLGIYDLIMSQTVKYSIMNDYKRTCASESCYEVQLNGDTCVRWMLDVKQELVDATASLYESNGEFRPEFGSIDDIGYETLMFNITEDMHIDEYESDGNTKRLLPGRLEVELLHSPLPKELPTVQKDLLIACAAYYGDVDRYARLRRPRLVHGEVGCCVRGVYHNTIFAVWWSKQPGRKSAQIEKAINARFIMNNVLTSMPFDPATTPYLIWWPTKAQPSTYRKLAKLQPDMLPQIIHACIYAGYKDLFDKLLPDFTPTEAVLQEAERNRNLYFKEQLQLRLVALGKPARRNEEWKSHISSGFGTSQNTVLQHLDESNIGGGFDIPYNGMQCDGPLMETMLCLPDALRIPPHSEATHYVLDYEHWPADIVDPVKSMLNA